MTNMETPLNAVSLIAIHGEEIKGRMVTPELIEDTPVLENLIVMDVFRLDPDEFTIELSKDLRDVPPPRRRRIEYRIVRRKTQKGPRS